MRADQAHRDDIGRRHAALVLELEEVVLCVAFHVCLGPPDRSCDGRPVAAPGGRVLQRSQKLAVLLVRPLGSRCVLWHAPSRRLDSHETMWQKRRQRPTLLETRHAPSPRSLRPRFFFVQLSWPFTFNIRDITIVFGSCQLAKVPEPVALRGRRTRRVQQDGRRREREGGGARSAIQPGQFRRGPWRLCAYLFSRCSAPLSGDSERRIATRSYASACSGL